MVNLLYYYQTFTLIIFKTKFENRNRIEQTFIFQLSSNTIARQIKKGNFRFKFFSYHETKKIMNKLFYAYDV